MEDYRRGHVQYSTRKVANDHDKRKTERNPRVVLASSIKKDDLDYYYIE